MKKVKIYRELKESLEEVLVYEKGKNSLIECRICREPSITGIHSECALPSRYKREWDNLGDGNYRKKRLLQADEQS